MQERRKTQRWQVNKKAKIKLEGGFCEAVCQIKDINFKGMQVILKIKLALDSYVKFSLILSEGVSFNAKAWVAWHKQVEGHNTYGLYFNDLMDSDKEKIYKFVYDSVPMEILKAGENGVVKREGGENMEDRRIFQRFNVRLPATLLDLNSGLEIQAETSDVSAKGIGLALRQELRVNTPLEAWLQIPDKGEPFYARGLAVWSSREGEAGYRIGMDLERADLMGLSRILRV